jgi:hypothetical protein
MDTKLTILKGQFTFGAAGMKLLITILICFQQLVKNYGFIRAIDLTGLMIHPC